MYDELKKVENPATGTAFEVIGIDSVNDFDGSIRFWVDAPHGKNAVIGFRLRITKTAGLTSASMEHDCKTAYPTAKWTGGSQIHGSTAGGIKVPFPAYQADNILAALKDADTGTTLFNAFTTVFPTMRFLLDVKQFNEFFLNRIERLLKGVPSDTTKAVVIDFMGYKKEQALNEQEVTIAEPAPVNTQPLMEEPQTL